jgi:hypothetical protein
MGGETLMAVQMNFESLGQLSLNRDATVQIGWQLFEGEFPPLINHTNNFTFGGTGGLRLRLSTVDHDHLIFRYSVSVVGGGTGVVVFPQSYVFPKVV